jgi:MFS transporter, DHA1 family, tetracycline resistance protein
MRVIARRAFTGLADSFRMVRGNARATLLIHPVWAITNNLYMPFLTLYMNRIGLRMDQIGLINAVSMIAGAVIALFAGWITDRMGRRRTNVISDTACWAVACLLWGLGGNFTWFLFAGLANAFVRLTTVSWNCTLAEGTLPEHRVNIYWWVSIVNNLGIFATPVAGLLIGPGDPASLISAMRAILLISSAALASGFITRYFLTRELPIGLERMEAARRQSPLDALKAYLPLLRLLRGNRLLLGFIAIRSIFYVQLGLRQVFLSTATVDGLGFTTATIGLMSLVTGAVTLLAQIGLLPKLKALPPRRMLLAGMAAMILGNALLVFSPVNNAFLLVLSTVVTAAGTMVTGLLADTSAANAMPDAERSRLMAFMTILMVSLSAPFMWVGGLLAGLPGMGPRLPLLLIMLLVGSGMVLLVFAKKGKGKQAEVNSKSTN